MSAFQQRACTHCNESTPHVIAAGTLLADGTMLPAVATCSTCGAVAR